jgi:hypothetical protein
VQSVEALLEEPFPPLAHHLPGRIQPQSDLVIPQSLSSKEHDLGTYHLRVRRRISVRYRLQFSFLLARKQDDKRAFPWHIDAPLER